MQSKLWKLEYKSTNQYGYTKVNWLHWAECTQAGRYNAFRYLVEVKLIITLERQKVLVFPRRCGRVAMGVVFVESDVGPGGHLAGRHQLLLDVPAGDTRSDRPSDL